MKAIIAVPATAALIYRAWSHKSLTPLGIAAATATAVAHAIHPWNLPFALLCVFFLAGTRVTKVKKDVKTTLTLSSRGSSGGEGPRTHVQVLANSLVASVLTLLHARQLRLRASANNQPIGLFGVPPKPLCFAAPPHTDLLVIGLVAHYAAVCADTFSSELGILSRAQPRLITSLTLRRVPRGTNGGVTLLGLGAGVVGSIIMVSTALIFVPFCPGGSTSGKDAATAAAVTLSKAEGWAWAYAERATLIWFLAGCGTFGSLLDSFLGGWLQRSVRDARSGKIVEGDGGVRVLVLHDRKNLKRAVVTAAVAKVADGPQKAVPTTDASNTAVESGSSSPSSREGTPEKAGGSARSSRYDHKDKHRKPSFGDEKPTRVIESGIDVLDNNQVNFLMALMISVGSMAVAGWYWGIPLSSVLKA